MGHVSGPIQLSWRDESAGSCCPIGPYGLRTDAGPGSSDPTRKRAYGPILGRDGLDGTEDPPPCARAAMQLEVGPNPGGQTTDPGAPASHSSPGTLFAHGVIARHRRAHVQLSSAQPKPTTDQRTSTQAARQYVSLSWQRPSCPGIARQKWLVSWRLASCCATLWR